MISGDVRRALGRAVAAAGLGPADPGLRPTGIPGQFASSIAFALGEHPGRTAARIAAALNDNDTALNDTENIGHAEVTGPGFITITVPPEALDALPERIVAAGPACASSDALRGQVVAPAPPADPLAAAGWAEARAALAARLTVCLAAAAGATVAVHGPEERTRVTPPGTQPAPGGGDPVRSSEPATEPDATGQWPVTDVAAAVAFAGPDAVRFALARAVPGAPARIDQVKIARQAIDNPGYAVRYAHARAASATRWADRSREPVRPEPRPSADRAGLLLLDALAWLPERVAAAARRGRPDEFARYLEELAGATIAALISVVPAHSAADPGSAPAPGTDRLGLAGAARTGLAAGLGLLGVSAPERL